jgi:hypothetical protein
LPEALVTPHVFPLGTYLAIGFPIASSNAFPRAMTLPLFALRHRHNFLAAIALAFLLGSIVGCGGGAQPEVGETSREQPQAQPNIVITSEAATRGGDFESFEGYLSQSPRPLRSTTGGPASASFPLQVGERGYYELFAWWPQAMARAGTARVLVKHRGGESSLVTDQRVLGGQWNYLGVFEFAPGAPDAVMLEKVGTEPLVVDAIRLRYVGKRRPELALVSEQLPLGLQDGSYAAVLQGAGGSAPYMYGLVEGDLPPGVALDSASGSLSGTCLRAGRYPFSIEVRDAAGARTRRALVIEVGRSTASEAAASGAPPRPRPPRREAPASVSDTPNLGNLLNIIAQLPEGGWAKVNLNSYSSVWTPADLRPLFGLGNPTPAKIILAWSSFAWDSNRGNLMLYGGGHANYRGNDTYLWRGSTQMWERASLPSEMVQDSLGNWNAVDSADKAPASAHTYDNTLFFPVADRLVVFGGAADANGGHYLRQASATTSRKTGLYLFDPSRADGDKVGGSTGSHVRRVAPYPDIVGGNMWSNRETWLNASATSVPPNEAYVNGCTGYATEDGKDVAYVRTTSALYKYTLSDLSNPAADTWQRVGVYWNGPGSKATCAYDASRKALVRTATNAVPFVYWNLNTPGPSNKDATFTPSDPTGEFAQLLAANAIVIADCGLDFDARRRTYALWCGDGRVWTLTPPPTLSPNGWTITKNPTPTTPVPNGDVGTGVLGKWKYIPNLDTFIGLQDSVAGNVWVYKPVGWTNPSGGNLPPSVRLTQPSEGASFASGVPIDIAADAADNDGFVVKVEFFNGTTKIGESLSAPYGMAWNGAPNGSLSLSALATDDQGAQTTSTAVSATVAPAPPPNSPPSVAITQPTSGASFNAGDTITIAASASDSDGIAKVEFFSGAAKLGEALAAPYSFDWAAVPAGNYSLTATATDGLGAKGNSTAVAVTVSGGSAGSTLTLQRGANAYSAVSDTYLSSYAPSAPQGAVANMLDYGAQYSSMLRFGIFQSEGGPVPNGAHIRSAALSIYKYSGYNMVYGVHRVLKDWSEAAANWNQAKASSPWAAPGANAAGSDYASVADASATTDFNPGWVDFDVTAAVQQMSESIPTANYGWRLRQVSGYVNALKRFYSSEYAASPTLRPKLVVTYD